MQAAAAPLPVSDSAALVRSARQGDHRAFTDLVRHNDEGLRRLAYRLLGDRDVMDDVLQDAYVKAFRALASFRGDATPGTWLYRIVYNACLDELRRRGRTAALPVEALSDRPAPGPNVDDAAGERQRLSAALATLPPDQRAAVLLVDAEGFDYMGAAQALGVADGTVRSRVSRGRAALRRALAGDREGDER